MRWINWRRAIAVIAMLVGVAVGATSVPASAAVVDNSSSSYSSTSDNWW
jgi:hypothetical protein